MERVILFLTLSLFIVCQSTTECTSTSPATQNNYTVSDGNITCVVMTTMMQLKIPYSAQSSNLTATVNITDDFSTSGTCTNNLGQNTLNISLFEDAWNLIIVFKNTTGSNFEWSAVELTYVLDKIHFPNVSSTQENNTVKVNTNLKEGTKKALLTGSYQCDASSDLQLNNSIILTLIHLQYRAFGNDNSTWFKKTGIERCNPATEHPETPVGVTVSVGIAVGALMVVVIVMYLLADKIMGNRKLSYD